MMTTLTRAPAVVDALMEALPYAERRWCGLERCECSGCADTFVSRDEWLAWFKRQTEVVCANCDQAVRVVAHDGKTYLACETCDVFWA
jgi:hypothetical protein